MIARARQAALAWLAAAILCAPIGGCLWLSADGGARAGLKPAEPSASLFNGCGYSSESCELP